MDLITDFKAHQERITSSILDVVRTSSQISSQDLSFYRSSSEKFSESLDTQSTYLLRLTNKLLKAASKDTSVKAPTFQEKDDIEDNWRRFVDVVDDLLEKADASLDEFTGLLKRQSPAQQGTPEPPTKRVRLGQAPEQWAHASTPKPQLLFNKKVDNYDTQPWKPLLQTKPHALIPLSDSIGSADAGYKNPYAHEIEAMQYSTSLYQTSPPIEYLNPDESKAIFVDTEEGLSNMLEELRTAKEIAIDLEHNDKNSYVGLVCLMQISTRGKDWIVDTLKPWRENLQILNEVFADPTIVKVFHGSTSDIIWLQRDLGLYVVGLFDTYHASSALHFPGKSLKYLLQRFANFEAQKQYQLADWRIRPLPQELLDYARSDTHFLLYIYDNLRNMLLEASTPGDNLMTRVLDNSRSEALQVYERPVYDKENGLGAGGWLRMLMQRSTQFTNEQFGVFRAVHQWRDQKARELDEGEQNIMPNSWIFTLAEIMPQFRGAFYSRAFGRTPRHLTENIPDLIEVVKKGREEGRNGPTIYEAIEKNGDKVGFFFGRNKYPRKQNDDTSRHNGIGATLQMLNVNGGLSAGAAEEVNNTVSEDPIATRLTTSQFFGRIDPVTEPSTSSADLATKALSTIVPLHMVARASLEGTSTSQAPAKSIPNAEIVQVTQVAATAQESKDDVFTLRKRDKKLKAFEIPEEDQELIRPQRANDVSSSSPVDDLSFQSINPEQEARSEAKRARKAEKKVKKEAEAARRAESQANMVPFDYANAESLLNAGSMPIDQSKSTKAQRAKPLDPFAKALDASAGAKRNRMGKELAGRSHTFKS